MNSAQCEADRLRHFPPQRSSPLLDAMIAELAASVEDTLRLSPATCAWSVFNQLSWTRIPPQCIPVRYGPSDQPENVNYRPNRPRIGRTLYCALLHVVHHRRREDTDPGMCKKACVRHEHLVRARIQREGVGSIMCMYLVQHPICIGTVLLNHR
jgi:hypothetical protein